LPPALPMNSLTSEPSWPSLPSASDLKLQVSGAPDDPRASERHEASCRPCSWIWRVTTFLRRGPKPRSLSVVKPIFNPPAASDCSPPFARASAAPRRPLLRPDYEGEESARHVSVRRAAAIVTAAGLGRGSPGPSRAFMHIAANGGFGSKPWMMSQEARSGRRRISVGKRPATNGNHVCRE
jgi:hypothetical protein